MFTWTDDDGTTHEIDIDGDGVCAVCRGIGPRQGLLDRPADRPVTCMACLTCPPGYRGEATFEICDGCGLWWLEIHGHRYPSAYAEAKTFKDFTLRGGMMPGCVRCS